MNGHDLRMHDNIDLHMLLDRLHRNELDFRERLARRVQALGGLSAISDPLYQRHSFALESLKAQRVAVEREITRREGSRERRGIAVPRRFERLVRRPAEHLVGWMFEKLALFRRDVPQAVSNGFALPRMAQRAGR